MLESPFSCSRRQNEGLNLRNSIELEKECGLAAKLCPALTTPWTIACLASLSLRFSRQKYWSGLPFPSPGNLPDPGIKPRSPALQADSLPTELQEKRSRIMQSPLPPSSSDSNFTFCQITVEAGCREKSLIILGFQVGMTEHCIQVFRKSLFIWGTVNLLAIQLFPLLCYVWFILFTVLPPVAGMRFSIYKILTYFTMKK